MPQATLASGAKDGQRVAISIKSGEEADQSFLLCAFKCVACAHMSLHPSAAHSPHVCFCVLAVLVDSVHPWPPLLAHRAGSVDSVSLDLILSEYAEFTVEGNAAVHLTGVC